jgi:hypothetical protein
MFHFGASFFMPATIPTVPHVLHARLSGKTPSPETLQGATNGRVFYGQASSKPLFQLPTAVSSTRNVYSPYQLLPILPTKVRKKKGKVFFFYLFFRTFALKFKPTTKE